MVWMNNMSVKNIMKKTSIYLVIFAIILNVFMPLNVFAVDEDFYSSNDILFYNSESKDSVCGNSSSSDSFSTSSVENQNIVAEFLTSTNFVGNNNKPLNAVQMAAIMGNLQAESGISPVSGVANNASHKGIVQWSSPGRWDMITDPKTDLMNQLNFLKTELDGSYKNNVGDFWNISDATDLDKATYLIARNYEVGVKNGGGSTDWTNNSDATNYIQGWENRKNYAQSMLVNFGNLAGFTCNGMDESQAISYMETYENSDGKDLIGAYTGCSGYSSNEVDYESKNILANCVAVVKYFLQNHVTTDHVIGLPNGGQVVGVLIQNGFTDGGNTPKPYAIFSTYRYSSDAGHTGLVLGVTDEYMIVFEEGCNSKLHKDGDDWAGINKYSLSEASSNYTFAYPPEGSLKNL